MRIILLSLVLSASFSSIFCQQDNDYPSAINEYIEELMAANSIPGVALAIVEGNKVVYTQQFGFANIEHQVPISERSIFRLYSLTKPVIAVGVFQLIEAKKLSLEDELEQYLPDLPLKWRKLRIKHLLSHASGLPDMAPIPEFQDLTENQAFNRVAAAPFRFSTGERYDYNQTGFYLLQKVIEAIVDQPLADWVLKEQFPKAKSAVLFSSDSRDIVLDRATAYFPFVKGVMTIDHPYLRGTYSHAMNGLNTTVAAFAEWDIKLRNGQLLKKKTLASMWETYPYAAQNSQEFTYGWDKREVAGKIAYGFSGSFVTAYRVYPEEDVSIILFSNGLGKFHNIENAMDSITSRYFND